MGTEAGEYIVGAYLQHVYKCGIVQYNARLPGGKLAGLNELDVLGINLTSKDAYLCEVTTHLHGMAPSAAKRVAAKFTYQKSYAKQILAGFTAHHQLWSPLVAPAQARILEKTGFELVINADFTKAVDELRQIAKDTKHDPGNPFLRTLQILAHLKPA